MDDEGVPLLMFRMHVIGAIVVIDLCWTGES
jgi:hypothetical protein